MKKSLFPAGCRFYKANLHAHTVISDGHLTPEGLRDAYRARGYAIVVFTDHELMLDHRDLALPDFLPLRGYETAVKTSPSEHTGAYQKVYHLNLFAPSPDAEQPFFNPVNSLPGNGSDHRSKVAPKREVIYRPTVDGVNELVRLAHEDGFLISLNHPEWSMIPPEFYLQIKGLDGLEVYNTGCRFHGDNTGLPYAEFLRAGARLAPFAGDDNHNKHGFDDSFGGYTVIAAESLSYDAVFDAMKRGRCYVSDGPELLSVEYDDETVEITCSPVSHILLRGDGRIIRRLSGDGVTHAVFPLGEGFRRFFRVELQDGEKRAFSRGVFTDGTDGEAD